MSRACGGSAVAVGVDLASRMYEARVPRVVSCRTTRTENGEKLAGRRDQRGAGDGAHLTVALGQAVEPDSHRSTLMRQVSVH